MKKLKWWENLANAKRKEKTKQTFAPISYTNNTNPHYHIQQTSMFLLIDRQLVKQNETNYTSS
ncbi:hypothetical protein DOY81_001415 [Sarcophaga bullata]|nr:hypothetical protein DOY81_001415 [Sarcophaga bullata]